MRDIKTLNIADLYKELLILRQRVDKTERVPQTPFIPSQTQPQAANQIRNGSYAHSVGSWANVATADDRRYECMWWFSHPDTANFALNTSDTTTAGLTFTVVAATDICTTAANTFLTGDVVKVTTTTTLPAPLLTASEYYIIFISTTTFKLATTVANAYAGTAIDITDVGTGTHTIKLRNYSLKSSEHALYSSTQSNWSRSTAPAGVARLNEDFTLDAILPQPSAEPGYVMFAVFNCAKANQYVYAPVGARISSGIYARQNSVWDYLYGNFTLTATASGTVTIPTSRDYVIHARTDRGFTIQSTATNVASAPSTADFGTGARVILSWAAPLQYGILGYDIYRKTLKTFIDANVTTGTGNIASTNHDLSTTDPIRLTTTGVLPTAYALNTTYFVIRVDDNNIKLATSAANATAGTAITGGTAAGGGTHTMTIFRLLERVESGLTFFIDNGSYVNETVTAYPATDFTKLTAFTATLDSVLANIASDGVDANWDTLPFAIKVPATYNHSLTDFARGQWARWNLTGLTGGRFDLRVTDAVTYGSQTVTSAAAQFHVGMIGLTATVTNKSGQVHTGTIGTYTSTTEVGFAFGQDVPFVATNAVMVVNGGGAVNTFYIDLAHLSFGASAIFGFHPDDLSPSRGVPAVAANGSNQGGATTLPPILPGGGGGGGGVDGTPQCVFIDEKVTVTDGAGSIFQKRAEEVMLGEYIIYGNEMSQVGAIEIGVADIWEVVTENGFKARTSDTHKYLTFEKDRSGKAVMVFSVGDDILTQIDGKDVLSKVKSIQMVQEGGIVFKFRLIQRHRFLIGTWEDGVCRKWGGICSENRKVYGDAALV